MPGKHKNRASYRDPDRVRGQRLSIIERTQILTLYNEANWPKRKIAQHLKLAETTVRRCIVSGYYTPQKPQGQPLILTTQKRKRLIARATLDPEHRRLPYEWIAQEEGIEACRRTLTAAFEKEKYYRRIGAEKPYLTEKHTQARLAWARMHQSWDFSMWKQVIWTDECSIKMGGFGKVWVTRTAEEKYQESCLVPKFKNFSCFMIHGTIGIEKGPLMIFDKGIKINSKLYTEAVLPQVYKFCQVVEKHEDIGFMRSILMEDNAAIHRAQTTQQAHIKNGNNLMIWPANSPDLNPIENVWRLLKYRIGRHFPRTNIELKACIQQEWEKLVAEDYLKYIESMPQRCKAVIEANGGHTKW